MICQSIYKLLENERLCFLATCFDDKPHLSLMNFTYLTEEDVIVLSSRLDTTKVANIMKNPEVAIMLCDLGDGDTAHLSCTLYGRASILNSSEESFYRKSHLNKHNNMTVFIEGENIVVILVKIKSATISDAKDHVQTWSMSE